MMTGKLNIYWSTTCTVKEGNEEERQERERDARLYSRVATNWALGNIAFPGMHQSSSAYSETVAPKRNAAWRSDLRFSLKLIFAVTS